MSFLGIKFKRVGVGTVISYTSSNEVAGVIFGKRAIFYYPPGCSKGWTLKRIVVVSLFCYAFWSVFFMAMSGLVGLFL